MWLLVYEYETTGSRGREKTCRAAVLQVFFRSGVKRTITVDPNIRAATDSPQAWDDLRELRHTDEINLYNEPLKPLP
jgi:hypothetical protein